ncbi:MAG: PAS domain S-box protein, partial [Dehalococcoidales bacterium]
MNSAQFFPILLLSCSLLMAIVVVLRAWRYRGRPVGKVLLWLMVALVWWLLSALIENISTNPTLNIFWMRMCYLGIAAVPVLWLVFTLNYSEKGAWWRRRGLWLLFIVPAITNVLVWTNGLHHLMWQEIQVDASVFPALKVVSYNIWFWVHAIYSYLMVLVGTFYLFNLYSKTSGIFRKQVGVMLAASFIPWVANVVFITKIAPAFTIDPTPMAFVVTCVAFLWGLSSAKLLNIMPVAYEAIFKSISDGVIVIDEQNRIQEINPAIAQILQMEKDKLLGKKLSQVIPAKAYFTESISDSSLTETVVSLGKKNSRRYYRIDTSPIFNEQRISGRLVFLHDITERRKAENESREKALLETELNEHKKMQQALTDSSSKLQALSEESPAIICNVDLKGCFTYVNKKFEEASKYRREEILGKNGFTLGLFGDDVALRLKERLQAKLQGKRSVPMEIQFIQKDGGRIWISLIAEPIRENNIPIGIQIIAQDITEHKKMEEAQANEAMWRRILIEQSRDGIVILDNNGKVYEANHAFCEMLGYTPEEISRLHLWDWETRATREDLKKQLNDINRTGGHFETRNRRKDGTIIDVDICTNGATFAGEKLILCVCRDITERKQVENALRKSEEKYRMIFESANDVIILTDKKGNIVDVNEKISNIGGYHREELIGKSFATLTKVMPKKSIAIVAKNYALRLLGAHIPAYEVEMYRSDGQLINIEINAVAVKEDDKTIGTLATLRDVTERKKSESALKYQQELIEQIIATIPNAVLVINEETKVLLANDTFYKNFRLKKKDVENKPIGESIQVDELDQAV